MISWVILAITAIVAAALAGFAIPVAALVVVVALIAAYLEPRKNEPEEASTIDS